MNYIKVTNPSDLVSSYLIGAIDGINLPSSVTPFSDTFTTNTSCSLPYQLNIYTNGTKTVHTDLDVYKNTSTNLYSVRVVNMAYFLTERIYNFDLELVIAPGLTHIVTVAPNTTFTMQTKAYCNIYLSMKTWNAPEVIEGVEDVTIKVQKDGSRYVQTENKESCSITSYAINVI